MTKYKIKQTSELISFATIMIGMLLGGLLAFFVMKYFIEPDENILIFILCFGIPAGLALFLNKSFAGGELEITMDDYGINIHWSKQFRFHNKSDKNFRWIDIKDYVFDSDSRGSCFILNLKNKPKFYFNHNKSDENKDDFQKFIFDFREKIEQFKNGDNDEMKDITETTMYQTTSALVVAIVLGVLLFFVIPFLKIKFEFPANVNYTFLLLYLFGIRHIYGVYNYRSKRNEK